MKWSASWIIIDNNNAFDNNAFNNNVSIDLKLSITEIS